ncbi:MAG: hypothetical protein IKK26_03330 [Clostridia bacterium]|nr:hypothetical protein [Clostridia bacterium]
MNKEQNVFKSRFKSPEGCSQLSLGVSLSLTAVSSILAGAFPSDYGGVIFLIVAVGLFAYVLTARFNLLYVAAAAVVSVLISMACGVIFPLALVSLAYIPLAFVISEAVRKRMCLSSAVTVLTVTMVILSAVGLGLCWTFMRDDLVEAVNNISNEIVSNFRIYIDKINAAAEAAGKEVYTENNIDALKNAIFLLMPSIIVLCFMAISYLMAKVFRLATIVADSSGMFYGGIWPISASLTGSVIFGAAYIVSMLSFNNIVVYYSAANIMYMFMPAQAIIGLRLMFGRGGFFRSGNMKFMNILTIALCMYFVFVSPILLFELAAIFTVFYNIRVWLFLIRKNKKD